MLLRATLILVALIALSVGLGLMVGNEVLAALGAMLAQAKVILGKAASLSGAAVLTWLKAQGINFARVEIAKRWFLKSLIPLVIGAAAQRRIANAVGAYVAAFKARSGAASARFKAQPLWIKAAAIVAMLVATAALTMSTLSLWLLVFSVKLPIWAYAGLGAAWQFVWTYLQKLIFRTVAFMQLYRVWGWMRKKLPRSYLERKRRFDFRLARIVVRRRRMTVAQLHAQKHGLKMRLALLREYFRHRRPETPTREEMDGRG